MLSDDGDVAPDCLSHLTVWTEKLKDSAERNDLAGSMIEVLAQVLSQCANNVDEQLPVITESFRVVRNACAGCKTNQDAVRESGIIKSTTRILGVCCESLQEKKSSAENEAWTQCVRCGVQALGNAAVNSPSNQTIIWDSLQPKLLLSLLQLNDVKVTTYACMVLHSCLSSDTLQFLTQTPEGVDVSASVLRHLSEHDTEWGLYIIERLLESDNSIMPVYSHVGDKERLVVLEIVEQRISSYEQHASSMVSSVNLADIAGEFKKNAHLILELSQAEDMDAMEASVVSKQLSVLCALTSHPKLCPAVQNDQDLIQCTVNLMQSIQMIGEQGKNPFSALPKASDQASVDNQHPVFGLKRDLIRLLANMAYQNTQNQNKIREAGGIQLIMNHTNIDAHNPYMMQWAIFAIHNLCEDNPENQAVISGLKLEGVADNVEKLNEFGVQAEMEGDKIVVKQVDKTKSPFSNDKEDKAKDS